MNILKYRIIEESDLNGYKHYIAEIFVKGLFWSSWYNLSDYYEHAISFKDANEARKAIYSKMKSRRVIEEDEIRKVENVSQV